MVISHQNIHRRQYSNRFNIARTTFTMDFIGVMLHSTKFKDDSTKNKEDYFCLKVIVLVSGTQ